MRPGSGSGPDRIPHNGYTTSFSCCEQGQAVFPTDWAGTMGRPSASSMVRMRVELKRKGVARRGATLFADDLPIDSKAACAEPAAEPMAEEPLHPASEAMTETVAMEEPTAVSLAEPSAEPAVEDEAEPMVVETAIGNVTSELPRGSSRSAAATALCSPAALQRLRCDVRLHCVPRSAVSSGVCNVLRYLRCVCRDTQQPIAAGKEGRWALRVFLQDTDSTVRRAAVIRPFAKSGDPENFWI